MGLSVIDLVGNISTLLIEIRRHYVLVKALKSHCNRIGKLAELYHPLLIEYLNEIEGNKAPKWVSALERGLEGGLEAIQTCESNPLKAKLSPSTYSDLLNDAQYAINDAMEAISLTNAAVSERAKVAITNMREDMDSMRKQMAITQRENLDFVNKLMEAMKENQIEVLNAIAHDHGLTDVRELQLKLSENENMYREKLKHVKDSSFRRELEVAVSVSHLATAMQEYPDDFRCPITLEVMQDPVCLVQSGHTYEKKALLHALVDRPRFDPKTNEHFEGEAQLIPNHSLRGAIAQWNDDRSRRNSLNTKSTRNLGSERVNVSKRRTRSLPQLSRRAQISRRRLKPPPTETSASNDKVPESTNQSEEKTEENPKVTSSSAQEIQSQKPITKIVYAAHPSVPSSIIESLQASTRYGDAMIYSKTTKKPPIMGMEKDTKLKLPVGIIIISICIVSALLGSMMAYIKLRPERNLKNACTYNALLLPQPRSKIKNFGSNVGISGDTIIVSEFEKTKNVRNFDVIEEENSTLNIIPTMLGSAQAFNISGYPVGHLYPPNERILPSFGYSIAASDFTIVIGAPFDKKQENENGIVYLYSTDDITYKGNLSNPHGKPGDGFGSSVGIFGDIIIVGAPDEIHEQSGYQTGAVHLFSFRMGYIQKIVPPDQYIATSNDFGHSVAISAEFIVVGSRLDNVNGEKSGSAYLYSTNGIFHSKLEAPDNESEDYFGESVAIYNNMIVVGSPGDENGDGSAHVFTTSGNYVQKLMAPISGSGSYFGERVHMSENRIVVGSQHYWGNGKFGRVYIFRVHKGDIVETIEPPEMNNSFSFSMESRFGSSVSISDSDVLVIGEDVGLAHVYTC